MSNADNIGMAYVEETEWGTTPSGPPTLQDIRLTGESLQQNTEATSSAEIRDDRQVTDVIRTNIGAQGDINFELSYGAYDDFLMAALEAAAWSTLKTDTQTTFAAVNSDNSFTDSGDGFVTAGFVANQWIKVSGFSNAANNGYFKIVSVEIGKIVVENGTLVDESATPSVTILMGSQILNGTTLTSFSIEKVYSDLSNILAIYTGMAPESLSLSVDSSAIITGSFGFLGKTEASASATVGDGTNDGATTASVMNAIDHVTELLENMTSLSFTGLTISLTNNLRSRMQVGSLGPVSLGQGKCAVSGTLTAYFATQAILDKYLNQTVTSLSLVLEDTAGNGYVIDLPQVKYTDGKRVAGGENTDIIADLSWTAYRNADEDCTARIVRFAAA